MMDAPAKLKSGGGVGWKPLHLYFHLEEIESETKKSRNSETHHRPAVKRPEPKLMKPQQNTVGGSCSASTSQNGTAGQRKRRKQHSLHCVSLFIVVSHQKGLQLKCLRWKRISNVLGMVWMRCRTEFVSLSISVSHTHSHLSPATQAEQTRSGDIFVGRHSYTQPSLCFGTFPQVINGVDEGVNE